MNVNGAPVLALHMTVDQDTGQGILVWVYGCGQGQGQEQGQVIRFLNQTKPNQTKSNQTRPPGRSLA